MKETQYYKKKRTDKKKVTNRYDLMKNKNKKDKNSIKYANHRTKRKLKDTFQKLMETVGGKNAHETKETDHKTGNTDENENIIDKLNKTRLFVNGLPKYLTEAKLKKRFEPYGDITDVKIITTSTGVSRCFGYIGFVKEKQATAALRQLNNTYIDTHKIEVEYAKPRGNSAIPRPWSKYSQGSSAFDKLHPKAKEDEKQEKIDQFAEFKVDVNDPEFIEFLNVSKRKGKKWGNDEQKEAYKAYREKKLDGEEKMKTSEEEEGDEKDSLDNEAKEIAAIKEEERRHEAKHGTGQNGSDLDFLQSKIQEGDDDSEDELELNDMRPTKRKRIIQHTMNKADVAKTGRLFLRNLRYQATEEEIFELMSHFGEVTEVHIPIDKTTRKPLGYAFVTFMFSGDAAKALEEVNNTYFQGRIIHVLPAHAPAAHEEEKAILEDENASHKDKVAAKRKMNAGDTMNWNSLYMRSDAVADAMAKQLGMSKKEFLEKKGSENMAVQLARGETELIRQTKEAFTSHGVNFEILNNPESFKKRSKHIILVKNLPSHTPESEIHSLFSPFGQIEKIVMAPGGVMALVKYYERAEARKAFGKLSFVKFGGQILYLEWAPANVLHSKVELLRGKQSDTSENKIEVSSEPKKSNAPTTVLYIYNLDYETMESDLEECFQNIGIVPTSVKLIRDAKSGKNKGYGFVSCKSVDDAVKALQKLNRMPLYGRMLKVEYQSITKTNDTDVMANVDGKALTFKKLVVKNLAFQCTRKELFGLFKPYGEIVDIRLPQKVAGGSRGFAFVEFHSAEQCHAAYVALKDTHLYGRHLVLQFAADDHSLEAARSRAKDSLLGKKRKRSH